MEDVKLVIFDLDGTLIDAYPAITASFNYTMRKLGLPNQKALTIRRAVGWGDENLLKPFVPVKGLKKAVLIYRRHHKKALIQGSRLLPGVAGVLAYLKKSGYRLAVASNRPTKFSGILIRHLKLRKYFAYVLCADKLRHGKPYPEILYKIIKKFSFSAKEALYVY
ncbi:MAG: HAD-IA family hydrolase [Candidatus Omnitrophica bacterium]|nr:HAD-IA family hydrolase [Candidatus Omnitrophota bacterium]